MNSLKLIRAFSRGRESQTSGFAVTTAGLEPPNQQAWTSQERPAWVIRPDLQAGNSPIAALGTWSVRTIVPRRFEPCRMGHYPAIRRSTRWSSLASALSLQLWCFSHFCFFDRHYKLKRSEDHVARPAFGHLRCIQALAARQAEVAYRTSVRISSCDVHRFAASFHL